MLLDYRAIRIRKSPGNIVTDLSLRCMRSILEEPLSWRKPRMVFVNSMSDSFHHDVSVEFIHRMFTTMARAPQHIFQVLTKRAERMAEIGAGLDWPRNVWAGVTVESADYLERLEWLRRVPATVRFVSFEPLLSEMPAMDLSRAFIG